MRLGPETWHWQSLLWWLAVLAVVVQLKHHYSIATAADLEWMLRPLSQVLEWLTGHHFHRDGHYEWVSESANVRLVKACAGINFMLMSFMAYSWMVRPDRCEEKHPWSWTAGRLLLLCAATIAAWTSCLLANSLRIIVAMNLEPQGWRLDAIGIGAADLHRLIGMGIYLPLLSLQIMLGNRRTSRDALAVPLLLYLLLMVIVPVLTGNALQHPTLFVKHLLSVSVMVAVMCGSAFLCQQRVGHKRAYSELAVKPVQETGNALGSESGNGTYSR
jgi:exosortase K